MSRRSKSHFRRRLVLWGLLALLCIGLTELAVCAYADPALFQRTQPLPPGSFQTVRTRRCRTFGPAHTRKRPLSASLPVIRHFLEAPPMEDANITEFAVRADREILTGGTVAPDLLQSG